MRCAAIRRPRSRDAHTYIDTRLVPAHDTRRRRLVDTYGTHARHHHAPSGKIVEATSQKSCGSQCRHVERRVAPGVSQGEGGPAVRSYHAGGWRDCQCKQSGTATRRWCLRRHLRGGGVGEPPEGMRRRVPVPCWRSKNHARWGPLRHGSRSANSQPEVCLPQDSLFQHNTLSTLWDRA